MTREVLSNGMVAHVWAQQSQPYGRSANRNFFFRDTTLYSYGQHFPVARFVQTADGGRAVLLNRRSYSITTSGHQRLAARAIDGLRLPVFAVNDPNGSPQANLRAYEEGAARALREADLPRKRQATREALRVIATREIDAAEAFAAAFGIEWSWRGPDDFLERVRAEEAARRAEQQRREEARRAADAEDFAEWRAGRGNYCPYSYATDASGSVYMRVRGDNLETSRGASVPLRHAVRVFQFIRQCREAGQGFKANGRVIRVGHFTVTEITPQGDMVAGCHRFSWERIAEVAKEAGVFDAPPSDAAVEVRA